MMGSIMMLMSKLDSKERIEDVISKLMREGGGVLGSERKVKAESSGASRARSALGHHHMSSKLATSKQTKRLTPKEKAGVGQLVSIKGQFSWTKLMDQLSEVVGDKAVVSSLKTKLGDIREQYQNAFRASFSNPKVFTSPGDLTWEATSNRCLSNKTFVDGLQQDIRCKGQPDEGRGKLWLSYLLLLKYMSNAFETYKATSTIPDKPAKLVTISALLQAYHQ
ncbi:hypothetical protein BC829DRAFT_417784 [Chytridium lagenaria]|nr:hypothetical protein BC829DRAFT_417784 [Chytridium lagenaria]